MSTAKNVIPKCSSCGADYGSCVHTATPAVPPKIIAEAELKHWQCYVLLEGINAIASHNPKLNDWCFITLYRLPIPYADAKPVALLGPTMSDEDYEQRRALLVQGIWNLAGRAGLSQGNLERFVDDAFKNLFTTPSSSTGNRAVHELNDELVRENESLRARVQELEHELAEVSIAQEASICTIEQLEAVGKTPPGVHAATTWLNKDRIAALESSVEGLEMELDSTRIRAEALESSLKEAREERDSLKRDLSNGIAWTDRDELRATTERAEKAEARVKELESGDKWLRETVVGLSRQLIGMERA